MQTSNLKAFQHAKVTRSVGEETSPLSGVQPVILCGGSGSRLWPQSRADMPKQFLPLLTRRTLLQETAIRVASSWGFRSPLIVGNKKFRHLMGDQLAEVGSEPSTIILEPKPRNTAPAVALAALHLAQSDPDVCMLVIPSDHTLDDQKAFVGATGRAKSLAMSGAIVTFGVVPPEPHTSYGYIQRGKPWAGLNGCYRVARFVEKPDRKRAKTYLDSGEFYWNSGMFMFTPRTIIKELERYCPDVLTQARKALDQAHVNGTTITPHSQIFSATPDISIDHAVMECTKRAVVVHADFNWSDIGSWTAIADSSAPDHDGNAICGDVLLGDCQNIYARSSSRLVAAVGVRDLVIVETPDAVLVADKAQVQNIKETVSHLKAIGRKEACTPALVRRPWGTYEGVHLGDKHQVKHIVVDPGGTLSSQYHHHRAEHWVVVSGTARVRVGNHSQNLRENQSVFIPCGSLHRLANTGKTPVHLIEVQYGDYLGEDDIVRVEDVYGRVPAKADTAAE